MMLHHVVTINLKGLTRNLLDEFLDQVPGDADLSTIVGWDGTANLEEHRAEDLNIELRAEWNQPL